MPLKCEGKIVKPVEYSSLKVSFQNKVKVDETQANLGSTSQAWHQDSHKTWCVWCKQDIMETTHSY